MRNHFIMQKTSSEAHSLSAQLQFKVQRCFVPVACKFLLANCGTSTHSLLFKRLCVAYNKA